MKYFLIITFFWIGIFPITTSGASAAITYVPYLDVSINTYAPRTYTEYAKPLPTGGASITFTLNLFKATETTIQKRVQTQYQIVDHTSYEYVWYINEKLLSEGMGDKTFTYTVPRGIRMDAFSVVVEVRDKDGALLVRKKTIIPIRERPEIQIHVIVNDKVPLVSTETVTGIRSQSIKIIAQPYFFNVQDLLQLSFLWYEGRKKLPAESYQGGLFEIVLPSYPAQDTFKSVVYNTSFDLELAQKNFKIISK